MERTTRRYGLGTRVFATDPWTVIRRSAERRCLAATRPAAFALLEQAEDFYKAAESRVQAAKPLLLYYCFMNLAKAFILTCRQREDVNNAQHGLSERLDAPPNNQELINAFLNAYRTVAAGPVPAGDIQNFDELLHAIGGAGIPANPTRYDLVRIMPQVVPGHRLWVEGAETTERFVSLERIDFIQDVANREIWLNLYLFADDLRRINLTHHDLLERSRLDGLFREVACDEVINARRLICLEQIDTVTYNHRPSDEVPALVATVRHLLWRTVLSTAPYRKYYLYAAPTAEHTRVLP
jgi:hypothetical protein